MVAPTTSPIFAAPNQSDCSPESETITCLEGSRDFTSFTSCFKKSLSYHGHMPNLKRGSFSTCQAIIALLPLYLVMTCSIYFKSSSCCSVFDKLFAHIGKWHSGQRPVFMPTTYIKLAPCFSAWLICQSISLK